jgi:hypothetical protein
MKTLLKTMRHHAYYSNRVDIMKNLPLFRLICFVSIILLSCEKKNNYCSVCVNNEITQKEEIALALYDVKLSFSSCCDKIDSLNLHSPYSINYFFEAPINLYKYYSLFFLVSKQPIEDFKESIYSTLRAERKIMDEDVLEEKTKSINGINYQIIFFDNDSEISLSAYGKYSEDYTIYLSTGYHTPIEDSLTQIENKKEELVEDLLNRLYCVLSTIEITSTTLKSNDEKLD